jgi:general secretion pathway protein A
MYTAYYGFAEPPFNVTPDPRFFYANPMYQEASANLFLGVQARKGFITLTGEVGTGKTTLIRRLVATLAPSVSFALVSNPTLTFDELLAEIGGEWGLQANGSGRRATLAALKGFLAARQGSGGTAAVVIDEAHHLADDVLEHVRLLSNLETSTQKLLQIVLVGQPELLSMLDRPNLRSVKQRIALRCRLDRLKSREVSQYIDCRLSAAGYQGQALFTQDAVAAIAVYSSGIPRLINILCDNALIIGYAESHRVIPEPVICEAAADLGLAPDRMTIEQRADPASSEAGEEADRPSSRVHSLTPAVGSRRGRRGKHASASWVAAVAIMLVGGVAWGVLAWRGIEWLRDRRPVSVDTLDLLQRHQDHRGVVDSQQRAALVRQAGATAPDHEERRSPRLHPEAPPEERPSQVPPDGAPAASWRRIPVVLSAGTTLSAVASHAYGENFLLGLDLIAELSAGVQDVDRVAAGQLVQLPPLTRDTLVREDVDGSYTLILAVLRNRSAADRLARAVQSRGYEVQIEVRRLSRSLQLHRVEIRGLQGREAVEATWRLATEQGWLPTTSLGGGVPRAAFQDRGQG